MQQREFVRLYFSECKNELLMHDFNDHNKIVSLCIDLKKKNILNSLTMNAYRLVDESLRHISPSEFLIKEFQLNGFFRS